MEANLLEGFESRSEAAAKLSKLFESVGNLSEVLCLNPQELIKPIRPLA